MIGRARIFPFRLRAALPGGAAACLALLTSIGGARAQDAWLMGRWCAASGETMVVERSGPGFNEHTVCRWLRKPQKGGRVEVRIACANYYGDGTAVWPKEMRFRAVRTGPRTVSVRLGAGPPEAYRMC